MARGRFQEELLAQCRTIPGSLSPLTLSTAPFLTLLQAAARRDNLSYPVLCKCKNLWGYRADRLDLGVLLFLATPNPLLFWHDATSLQPAVS